MTTERRTVTRNLSRGFSAVVALAFVGALIVTLLTGAAPEVVTHPFSGPTIQKDGGARNSVAWAVMPSGHIGMPVYESPEGGPPVVVWRWLECHVDDDTQITTEQLGERDRATLFPDEAIDAPISLEMAGDEAQFDRTENASEFLSISVDRPHQIDKRNYVGGQGSGCAYVGDIFPLTNIKLDDGTTYDATFSISPDGRSGVQSETVRVELLNVGALNPLDTQAEAQLVAAGAEIMSIEEVLDAESSIEDGFGLGSKRVAERSLSLLSIWGTTLGLLSLIGGVGFIVARPLMGVAQRAEDSADEARTQRGLAEQRASNMQTLAHGLAHEIRSPLRSIGAAVGRITKMLNADKPERIPPLVEQATKSEEEARNTLDALLRIADSTDPKLERMGTNDLFDVIDIPEGFVVDADDVDQVDVIVDPSLVHTIVRNLMENAQVHGGPTFRITFGGGEIVVSDEGPGVHDAVELFSLGSKSPDSPGTGTGMAMSQILAKAMGAEVKYRRIDGKTFFVLEMKEAT